MDRLPNPTPIPWHRLFGFILDDVLHRLLHLPCEVKLEEDLSHLRQLLDVVIIRHQQLPEGQILPDGLDLTARHSLVTYKSHQEPLDEWAIQELIGHYVNYRKLESYQSNDGNLLSESDFQLYAVSTRYPRNLGSSKGSGLTLKPTIHSGVYHLDWGRSDIRVIVTSEIAQTPNNTLWNLFSNRGEVVLYGLEHYRFNESPISTIVQKLIDYYRKEEKMIMSYTIEDFNRDYLPEIIASTIASFPAETFLQHFSAEERLRGLPAEDRLKGLPAEELLKVLPTEVIERYLATIGRKH
ncbi:conserved hypothetical protein [Gammaproteobacteria bacterium]